MPISGQPAQKTYNKEIVLAFRLPVQIPYVNGKFCRVYAASNSVCVTKNVAFIQIEST